MDDDLRMLISLEDPDEDLSAYVPAPPLPPPSSSSPATSSSLFGAPISSSPSSYIAVVPPSTVTGSAYHTSPRIHYQSSSSSSGGWSGDEGSGSGLDSSMALRDRKVRSGSVGAGMGGLGDGGCSRVALAPLHSLQRNHPYRRCEVDDRALRLLGPAAGTR